VRGLLPVHVLACMCWTADRLATWPSVVLRMPRFQHHIRAHVVLFTWSWKLNFTDVRKYRKWDRFAAVICRNCVSDLCHCVGRHPPHSARHLNIMTWSADLCMHHCVFHWKWNEMECASAERQDNAEKEAWVVWAGIRTCRMYGLLPACGTWAFVHTEWLSLFWTRSIHGVASALSPPTWRPYQVSGFPTTRRGCRGVGGSVKWRMKHLNWHFSPSVTCSCSAV